VIAIVDVIIIYEAEHWSLLYRITEKCTESSAGGVVV
jgi:hypothetical protein